MKRNNTEYEKKKTKLRQQSRSPQWSSKQDMKAVTKTMPLSFDWGKDKIKLLEEEVSIQHCLLEQSQKERHVFEQLKEKDVNQYKEMCHQFENKIKQYQQQNFQMQKELHLKQKALNGMQTFADKLTVSKPVVTNNSDAKMEQYIRQQKDPYLNSSIVKHDVVFDDSNALPIMKLLHSLESDNYDDVRIGLYNLVEIFMSSKNDHVVHDRTLFTKLGGPLAIVMTMRKWSKYVVVQTLGSQVIHNASLHMDDAKDIAVRVGSCETILTAMEHHPNDVEIQISGLGALYSIASHGSNGIYLVKQLHGLRPITSAMQHYPRNLHVQKWGCCLLCGLSSIRDDDDLTNNHQVIKVALKEAGIIPLIVRAATENQYDQDSDDSTVLRGKAQMVLKNLSSSF